MQSVKNCVFEPGSVGVRSRTSNGWSGRYLAVEELLQEEQDDYRELQKVCSVSDSK